MIEKNEILLNIDPDDNFFNAVSGCIDIENQSNYYTIENFNSVFSASSSSNYFSICNYNIRSFNANFDCFNLFLDTLAMKFDIIVLTETRFTGDTIANIDDYCGHHSVRLEGGGGGVSLYYCNNILVNKIDGLSYVNDHIEVCAVKLNLNNETLIVIAIYRPPSGSVIDFNNSLFTVLNDPNVAGHNVILTGDLNINLIAYEHSSAAVRDFVYSLHALNFFPYITKPTRFPEGNQRGDPSLLDHFWFNKIDRVKTGIITFDQSDHLPTVFVIEHQYPLNNNALIKVTFRDFSDYNIEKFKTICLNNNFNLPSNDVNTNTLFLSNILNDIYCKCFPIKVKYLSQKRINKPWLSSAILCSIKKKSKYFKLYKLGLVNEAYYKRYRNTLTNVIRSAKQLYYRNRFQAHLGNSRKTWKLIGDIVFNKQSKKNISSVVVDDIEYDSPVDIANLFNDYFVSVAEHLNSEMPPPLQDPISNINVNLLQSMYVFPVTSHDIINITNSLKNSSYGLDSIPTRIFKTIINFISVPLASIVNSSFSAGIFPDSLKHALVIPLHKAGLVNDLRNYRPISILPLLSKIFEKCMYKNLVSYLSRYNILNSDQFGFRKGRSTSDALIHIIDKIYNALNSREHVFGVSIDFSKAFDTVSHSILIRKLYAYGIRGLALRWFDSYLGGRTQSVRVGGCLSTSRPVRFGVPQGSVLGPILFLIYINDINMSCQSVDYTLFADDTTVIVKDRNYDNLVNKTNSSLSSIFNWTINNRLSLNASKTSLLLFTNRIHDVSTPYLIKIDDVPVWLGEEVKFLGINIDFSLNFANHISYVCGKVSKTSGILNKIKNCAPQDVLLKIYYSLVYPYLTYGILLWGDAAEVHMRPLVSLQKRIIRLVTSSDFFAHSEPLFYATKILKLKDIYYFTLGCYMYRLSCMNLVSCRTHIYDTRFRSDAIPSFQRLTQCQRSISFMGPNYWNTIPAQIRNAQSYSLFKKHLKQYIIDSYDH